MKNRSYRHSGSRSLLTGTLLLVLAGSLLSFAVGPLGALKRAKLAKALNNGRQVTMALHGFAQDFDGQFPNEDTGAQLREGGLGKKTSNDYFRQLFADGAIQREELFWIDGAACCRDKKPDNIIMKGGKLAFEAVLRPGDCGWAYMTKQTNTSNLERPLLLSAYTPGTKEFEEDLFGGKVVIVRIDGAALTADVTPRGKVHGKDGTNLLSTKSAAWKGSGDDPAKLLVQPAPIVKAKPKPAPAKAPAR